MRPFLYVSAHKCLRNALSTISLRAGATAYDDDAAVKGLVAELRDVENILKSHASNEEREIHALLRKIQAPVDELEGMHRVIDSKIDAFVALGEKILTCPPASPDRQVLGLALYRAVAEFNAFYYAHMREEEERFLPMIWEKFSDEEIIATRARVHAGIPHDEMLIFTRYQFPALSPGERIDQLSKYKKQWTGADFAAICAAAEAVLAPAEWQALKRAVVDG